MTIGADVETEAGPADVPMKTQTRLRHQLALGLIMVALIPLTGVQAVWSADEGALLYQVRSLAEGGGWTFEHPFPEADPSGTYYPIHLSSWAADTGGDAAGTSDTDGANPGAGADAGGSTGGSAYRYVVLAKHVAFLWVAAGLYGIGGYWLLILLSVLAGLAAAVATSRLAGLIEPKAETPALWAAGLASPLLMHSYVAWGHTVAAALIGWGTYWLLGDDSGRSATVKDRVRSIGPALAFLFLACQIRTEAPLAVFAIGLALSIRRRGRALAVVAVAVTGTVVDRLIDQATGGPIEPTTAEGALGYLTGRIEAFTITWLQPAYGSNPIDLLILVAAALILVGAVLWRRGRQTLPAVQLLLAVATAALVIRLAVSPAALVPGLVAAFPALFGGLLLIERRTLSEDRLAELLGGFVLFCGAVLATQYRYGGGGEWGGRYFAVGLPFGIAVAAVAVVRAGARLGSAERRRTALLMAAPMLITSTLGLLGLRTTRHQTDQLAQDLSAAIDVVATTETNPVVISSIPGLGRWMWADVDRGRWLRVPSDELATTAARLQELGVKELAFVSRHPETELAQLQPWFQARRFEADQVEARQVEQSESAEPVSVETETGVSIYVLRAPAPEDAEANEP